MGTFTAEMAGTLVGAGLRDELKLSGGGAKGVGLSPGLLIESEGGLTAAPSRGTGRGGAREGGAEGSGGVCLSTCRTAGGVV